MHVMPEYFNFKYLGILSLTDLGIFAGGQYTA